MDLDELIKYIDADDDGRKKSKKSKNKKSTVKMSGSGSGKKGDPNLLNNLNLNSCNGGILGLGLGVGTGENINTLNMNNLNNIMNDERILDKEFEEFKQKLVRGSIKYGLCHKIKPRISRQWIEELYELV